MIEEYCRNIYNVGIKIDCSLSKINCLCPDKNSYEYLCYQCYIAQNDKASEEYQIKIDADSGKICIQHDFKYENFCASSKWTGYQIINIGVEDVHKEIEKSELYADGLRIVELVAMALACAAVSEDRRLPYVSMVDAFKPEQCMNHLRNLAIVFMQRIQSGKSGENLLMELCQCMEHLNIIYEQREKIGNEFRNYLKNICRGLESIEHDIGINQIFLCQANDFIDKKIGAQSIEKFVFCDVDIDGQTTEIWHDAFKNLCFVLRGFLINYQEQKYMMKEEYNKLIAMLNMFAPEEVDICAIRGLEKLNLQSTTAWKANAGIVIRYLRNTVPEKVVETYDYV